MLNLPLRVDQLVPYRLPYRLQIIEGFSRILLDINKVIVIVEIVKL